MHAREGPMKRAWLIGMTVVALGGSAMLTAQGGRSADVQMKAAQQKAEVQGDLKGAIEDYKTIVAVAGSNRALTAQALVRMAECYQKLGDAEANKIYERVSREFADQPQAVALARARLAATLPATRAGEHGIVTRQVWTGPKVNFYGDVSPDGRYLTFPDWGNGDLAVHDFSNGEDRLLTSNTSLSNPGQYGDRSVFAPDGTQVAYSW